MVRITTRVLLIAAALAAAGCGASEAELRRARTSGYATDFAIVYSEALTATRDLYAQLTEDARSGIIRTAWHPVASQAPQDDPVANSRGAQQLGAAGAGNSLTTGTTGRNVYFIRFVVYVVGGRPWRVRVEGTASLWKAGEVPTPLHGADVPPWLKAREDALRIAIYERLEKYAVPLKIESSERKPPARAALEPGRWPGLPPGAAKLVAEVSRATDARDVEALRRLMVDDFTWSFGDVPSADVAIATWQADPTLLAELDRALDAGCAVDAADVVCPAAAAGGDYVGYRAGFVKRDSGWRFASFIAGD